MGMCIHGGEYEACQFGCTFKTKEELKLEIGQLRAKIEVYKNCSKKHKEKCPETKCWVQELRDEQLDEIEQLQAQVSGLNADLQAEVDRGDKLQKALDEEKRNSAEGWRRWNMLK